MVGVSLRRLCLRVAVPYLLGGHVGERAQGAEREGTRRYQVGLAIGLEPDRRVVAGRLANAVALAGARPVRLEPGQAEVEDPWMARRLDHDVVGLHVAVNDPVAVRVMQRLRRVGDRRGHGAEVAEREVRSTISVGRGYGRRRGVVGASSGGLASPSAGDEGASFELASLTRDSKLEREVLPDSWL